MRPGDPWGWTARFATDAPVVHDDAALATLAAAAGTRTIAGDDGSELLAGPDGAALIVGLAGGDLCRTLGGRGDVRARQGGEVVVVPVDLGEVVLDGAGARPFCAHVLARRFAWAGHAAAIMNAEWVGTLRLAPRGHPGDGLLDITEGRLDLPQRLMARTRARTGDHLPHPALRTRRVPAAEIDLPRATPVWVDGVRVDRARRLSVRLTTRAVLVTV